MIRVPRYAIVAALSLLLLPAFAQAQSGPDLILKPWNQDQHFEVYTSAILTGLTNSQGFTEDFRMQIYESQGRFRLDSTNLSQPAGATQPATAPVATQDTLHLTGGYDFEYLDIHTINPLLPRQLVDQSAALGAQIAQFSSWRLDLVAGAGYAGNNPFADDDAIYAKASLLARHPLDQDSSLILTLSYNGNRTLWPDIPIPTVAYQHRESDTLSYIIGLPVSSVYWRPLKLFTLDATYEAPFDVDMKAEFEFYHRWFSYAAFENRLSAFHIDGAPDNQREFFSQRRIETGLRWAPCREFEILGAIGYAFGQEFSTGWDARDLTTISKIKGITYARFQAGIKF